MNTAAEPLTSPLHPRPQQARASWRLVDGVWDFAFDDAGACEHPREVVFDRQIMAHPDCIPPADMVRLGDFRDTIPAELARSIGKVSLLVLNREVSRIGYKTQLPPAANIASPSWSNFTISFGFRRFVMRGLFPGLSGR